MPIADTTVARPAIFSEYTSKLWGVSSWRWWAQRFSASEGKECQRIRGQEAAMSSIALRQHFRHLQQAAVVLEGLVAILTFNGRRPCKWSPQQVALINCRCQP